MNLGKYRWITISLSCICEYLIKKCKVKRLYKIPKEIGNKPIDFTHDIFIPLKIDKINKIFGIE